MSEPATQFDGLASRPAQPLVYAVVPAFNRCEKTLRFLHNFSRVTYPNKRVVITDDGSLDNTRFNIKLNFPDVPVLEGDGNLWWSGGTNLAIQHALEQGADYILTINDDVIMAPDFLEHMVAVARQNCKYIVGCRLQREDRRDVVWSLGTSLRFKGCEFFALNYAERRWPEVADQVPDPYPVDTMPGNGVLIPRAVFEQVGLYDAKQMPQYHADSDLVLRARQAGFIPVISVNSVLYNHILTQPLVNNRYDLVFNKKSDLYWRALWATTRRWGPPGRRLQAFLSAYAPFFVPKGVRQLLKRLNPKLGRNQTP